MKKAFVFAVAVLMLSGLGACGEKKAAQAATTDGLSPSVTAVGDWMRAESPEITEETEALLKKATGEIAGAKYTAVAYLGSQKAYFEGQKAEDAGMIHALLCRKASVPPDPAKKEIYAILYIHESLEGNAVITDIDCSSVGTNIADMPAGTIAGGWNQAKSPVITEEIRAAFDEAMEGFAGVNCIPVALAAAQVVSGTNYCIVCETEAAYPGAESGYALAYIHAALDGSAELLDIADFVRQV